jgi:PAS domain S-box-containing protein
MAAGVRKRRSEVDAQSAHAQTKLVPSAVHGEDLWEPARRKFIAIAVFAVLVNIALQFVATLLPLQSLGPFLRALAETIAVAVLVIPPAYYFYTRPLLLSLQERQDAEKTLRRSQIHYRIVSELTTTFVFDLSVGPDGKATLDFLSDNFYTFSGRSREDFRSFETLFSHIHPDDAGKLLETLKRLTTGPESTEIECRAYVDEPHVLRWLALYGKSEWDERQGRVTAIYGAVKDITERKRFEEALRASEQIIQAMLDAIPAGVFWKDTNLAFLGCNRTFAHDAGFSDQDDIIGKDDYGIGCPKDNADFYRRVDQQVLDSGQAFRNKEESSLQNGKRVTHLTSVVPLRDTQGAISGILGTYVDITQRKLTEQALRESEERFRGIFQHSASGMALVSVDHRFLQVNTAFCSMLGYSESELLGRSFQDVTLPEDRPRGEDMVTRVVSGELDHFHLEKRYQRKDGSIVWTIVSSTLFRDTQGRPLHFVSQVEDITDRKLAEKALQQSEERFRSIIEQSADGIVVTDEKGAVGEWNKAQEQITGLKRADVMGVPTWEVEGMTMPEDLKTRERVLRIRMKVEGLLRGDSAWNTNERIEHEIVCPDGNRKLVSEHLFVIKEGVHNLIVSIVSDITEKRKSESDRLLLDQLRQRAQRLESLGVLAGGIAHDFNNILMGVFGFTELAKSQAVDPTVVNYLSQAMESMNRAKALTQQLLTFSKGGAPVKTLGRISSMVKETCLFALSGSPVKCSISMPDTLWYCNVDKNQIGQVIQNLMLNALQAMPMGGLIEVSAENMTLREREHPTLDEGRYVRISIKDQGIGISEDMLSRVFDPFFTTKTKGHGLGLAISHSIVARHSGAINIQSELGKGTTFLIYLPACDEGCVDEAEAIETGHRGTGTILVMDDDEAIPALLSRMLQSIGYKVLVARDGVEALRYFEQGRKDGTVFAAMILDLTIPGGMGGKEVAAEIRKTDQGTPLFVASGYAEDQILANPAGFGFTASISKPFRKAELTALLSKHVRSATGS